MNRSSLNPTRETKPKIPKRATETTITSQPSMTKLHDFNRHYETGKTIQAKVASPSQKKTAFTRGGV
jgi:hypothetical protein